MNTHRLPSVLSTLIISFLVLGTAHAQKSPRIAPKPKPDLANTSS